MNKSVFAWSAVVVGVLVALTEFMAWPDYLQYVWGLLVLIWGFMAMKK